MKTYLKLLRQKLYIGFIIVLGCASLGAVRGAWREDKDFYIGVTKQDMEMMQNADTDMPDLIGIVGLAAEQNRWNNFEYAFIYAKRGVVIYCIFIAVYLPLYQCRFFRSIRAFLGREAGEKKLFFNADGEIS